MEKYNDFLSRISYQQPQLQLGEGKFEAATEVESLNEAKELISGINIETDIDSFHDYIPFRERMFSEMR